MTSIENINMKTLKKNSKAILAFSLFVSLSLQVIGQSPKKYFKNGFFEQAFVEAVHKQNKKVKLKKKHVEIINKSYLIIYEKHSEVIVSADADWQQSYNRLIRMVKFRAKVKHPGVYDKLNNILYDKTVLEHLALKFNEENLEDLQVAKNFESTNDYVKAFSLYQGMSMRHDQAEPITTLSDRLVIIDCESKIENVNQKIGDQYILEAEILLGKPSKQSAKAAIELIEKARSHRPLNFEEEELLTLANLFLGDSFIDEAEKLISTRTKKNARLAFELINRARSVKTLSTKEEKLLETAKSLGMTRILVKIKGGKPINDIQSLSGVLNKGKSSSWVAYYYSTDNNEVMDFEMEITENRPTVILSDIRKRVTQNTKTVEYWEEVTDAEGNTTKVKKTRLAIAMVTIVSQTKTAQLDWTILLKDLLDGKTIHSETKESKNIITHEYASLKSGDILALPEDIESDVELDSQPFPSDENMLTQIKKTYLNELNALVNSRKDHLINVNLIIE